MADSQGIRPIHAAALEGMDNVLSDLLHAGSEVNALTRHGTTALSVAAARGHTKVDYSLSLRLLLDFLFTVCV